MASSINSALGCIIADMRHDFVQTLNGLLGDIDIEAVNARIAELSARGLDILDRANVAFVGREVVVEFDMSYLGQSHTVDVPVDMAMDREAEDGGQGTITRDAIHGAFEARYEDVYGRTLEGIPIRVLNLKVAAIGQRPKFDLAILAPQGGSIDAARTGARPVWVNGAWHDTCIYERLSLPVGAVIDGPALLEQPDTTIFLEPDLKGTVDRFGNLVVTRREAS